MNKLSAHDTIACWMAGFLSAFYDRVSDVDVDYIADQLIESLKIEGYTIT